MPAQALKLVWEGIIIEYWRRMGKGIKTYKHDLRALVHSYWTRERDELFGRPALGSEAGGRKRGTPATAPPPSGQDGGSGFVPVYADTRTYTSTQAKLGQHGAEVRRGAAR